MTKIFGEGKMMDSSEDPVCTLGVFYKSIALGFLRIGDFSDSFFSDRCPP